MHTDVRWKRANCYVKCQFIGKFDLGQSMLDTGESDDFVFVAIVIHWNVSLGADVGTQWVKPKL